MNVSLGEVAQLVQLGFYVVGAAVAVLTYRSARRGLLNTVRTEYLKRVMDRLAEISTELASEFDPDSPHWWPSDRFAKELIEGIHEEYRRIGPNAYGKLECFDGGFRSTLAQRRMRVLLARIKSDPFVPARVREPVLAYLQRRIDVTGDAYWAMTTKYRKYLAAKTPDVDELEQHEGWFHNWIVDELGKRGFGIADIERQVDDIRLTIQKYFESFDPHARRERTA